MSVGRISTNSIQQGFPKYQNIWDGTSAVGSMEAISSIVVPSGGSTKIEFNNIPQTYTNLQIRGFFNQGGGNWINVNYNADVTAGAYQWHYPYGDGATASGGWSGGTSQTNTVCAYNNNATAFGTFVFDILDYTNTNKTKVGRSLTGYDANGSGIVMFLGNLWTGTAAINQILLSSSGTFAQYSTFSLYGIK